MEIRNQLQRFVDWDLKRKPITSAGKLTLLVGMLPGVAVKLFVDREGSPFPSSAMIVAIGFALMWFGFVGWRARLLFRHAADRADCHYDRKGKYLLPPEYADTESATKARWRRRNDH